MSSAMKIIDAYAHVGLPRFVSADDMAKVARQHGVVHCIAAGADTCPDLCEVARAQLNYPELFRSVGVPVGRSIEEILQNVELQLKARFVGIRVFDSLIVKHPQLLDLLGRYNAIPYVVGSAVLTSAVDTLVDFLDRHPRAIIVAPHFAGVPTQEPSARLLAHERFLIVFSRQGAHKPEVVIPWARRLIEAIGWSRLLFGSEYPVCTWRKESYADVLRWIDDVGLSPSEENRRAFFHDNAERILFTPRLSEPKELPDRNWLAYKTEPPK